MISPQMNMIPVRVVVETVRPQHCLSCSHDGTQMLDTFAIVSGQTMLGQLVDTVLSALGLPQLIEDSRGLIQINNWKPISFDSITDNQEELVANLFKEISSSIVLKILTKHSSTGPQSTQCITDLKQRLLKVAIDKQPQILTSVDNQEIKEVIQQMIHGDEESSSIYTAEHIAAINEWLDQISQNNNHKSPIQSSRFNQIFEIPRLERWFTSDPNPSRQKLLSYMHLLNGSPSRRAGNKVTYQQICNWFVNRRAIVRNRNQHSINGNTTVVNNLTNNLSLVNTELTTLRNNFKSLINNNTNNIEMSPISENRNALTSGSMTIPVATIPVDIRSKFGNSSNNYNPLLDRQTDAERIDGGSESPNGNDDVSVQSASDGYEVDVKGSGTSSPVILDVSSLSPSNQTVASQLFGVVQNLVSNSSSPLLQINNSTQNSSLGEQQNSNQQQQQNNLIAAFSSLMPSFINAAQFNNVFLNATASGAVNQLPASSSPVSSASSNLTNGFSTNFQTNLLKTSASSSNFENGVKIEPHQNNNNQNQNSNNNNNNNNNTARSRLMFDPLSELPILEGWFEDNPHPGCFQIEQYTETLNSFPYRQNYPPISTHNVKIWFKNRRAKCKRLNLTDTPKATSPIASILRVKDAKVKEQTSS